MMPIFIYLNKQKRMKGRNRRIIRKKVENAGLLWAFHSVSE